MSMSKFSLSSPFALFQSIVASDQEATSSSSTSSSSAINNSSTSLSLSPAANSQSVSIFSEIQQQQQQQRQQKQAFKFHNTSPILTTAEQTKQISKHLLELQREIKEEEDEIFADINSLINDRSNLYSSFDADDFEDNGVAINGGTIVNNLTNATPTLTTTIRAPRSTRETFGQFDETTSEFDDHQNREDKSQQKAIGLNAEEEDEDEEEGEEAHSDRHHHHHHHHNNSNTNDHHHHHHLDQDHPHNQHQQQCELGLDLQEHLDLQEQQELDEHQEHHHHQQHREQSFQEALQQQKRDIHEFTSNLPKPCVFFLEGNCRRSDCKFSHDLSSIICKYWIEGFCFKGEMCPFSHSLTPKSHDSRMLNDENQDHLGEKALNPTFVIESEADFPSLPLDAPATALNSLLDDGLQLKGSKQGALAKTIKNQILSSNPTVVFKTTKKKRKKG